MTWWTRLYHSFWWGLIQSSLVGGAAGLGISLIADLAGYGLRAGFVVVLGGIIAAGVWVLRQVEPGAKMTDPDRFQPGMARNSDPMVRKLERDLYGSRPQANLASPQLQQTIAELVDWRLADDGDRDRLSPLLRRYLDTTPAPPLDRRKIRRILRELDAL